MKKIVLIICFVCFTGLVYFLIPKPERRPFVEARANTNSPSYLVKIGAEKITPLMLKHEFQTIKNTIRNSLSTDDILKQSLDKDIRRKALNQLIERKALVHFTKKDENPIFQKSIQNLDKCLDENASDKTLEQHLKTQACESGFLKEYFKLVSNKQVQITDQQVKRYYKKHKKKFFVPKKVLIRHILLESELKAREIRSKVNIKNFAEYAEKYSIAEESQDGGILGPFSTHNMPRVFSAAFSLRRNQISEVIRSAYGFHIFMKIRDIPGKTPKESEISFKVEEKIRDELAAKEYRKTLQLALQSVEKNSAED